jgi:hypothetical protein
MSHTVEATGMDHVLERATPQRRRPRRLLVGVVLVTWAGFVTLVAASLMAGHWTSLPRPAIGDAVLQESLARLRASETTGRWQAVHVLYAACRCSNRVLDHLLGSSRPADLDETIVLVVDDSADVDDELARRVRRAMQLQVVTRRELAERFHIESAPLLLVAGPDEAVRYSGGYSYRKQDPVLRDVEIISALQAAHVTDQLPVYGCGVSDRLQVVLDPLGIK